jgi:DNA-binding protein YbaB
MFDKLKNGADQAKKLYELQKQAKVLKEELSKTAVSATNAEETIKVVMNCEQKVMEVEIKDAAMEMGAERLGMHIKDVVNKSIEKTHKIAAEKMQGIAGGMGLF